MRKKSISHFFDIFMWYAIYMLPLIIFVICYCVGHFTTLADCFVLGGLDIFADNFIFSALNDLFGVAGVMPLFAGVDILHYATYFISIFLLHLAVDVLLFIPRFAHKCVDCFGGAK